MKNKMRWLDEALEEMRAAGRPGIVLVVPDDHHYLEGLSDSLQLLFGDVNALDPRPVFACVRASTARARFGNDAALLALDAAGRLSRSKKDDLHTLLQPSVFAEAVAELLQGMSGPTSPARRPLPYGVEWDEEQHHKLFGTAYDPCPPCGMPHVENNTSRLIRYLKILDPQR